MKKLAFVILSCSVMIFINGCGAHWGLQNSRAKISSEWEMLEFLISDEGINKRIEVDNCRAKGDDNTQCDKILDSWRESCARGEEKYCIAIFAIQSKSDYVSYFIFDSLGAVVRNCDNGMAGSCHAVGEYYYNFYTESPNGKEALSMSESALLYLQKACDLGMAVSCSFVAQMYKYGHFQDATEQAKYTRTRRVELLVGITRRE